MNIEADHPASLRNLLTEAQDEGRPLPERILSLARLGCNLDRLIAQLAVPETPARKHPGSGTASGRAAQQRAGAVALLQQATDCFTGTIEPALRNKGICLVRPSELSPIQQRRAHRYFQECVLPVLTPLGFDHGRPFPKISNLSLNLAAWVSDPHGRKRFARIKVPESLPQILHIDGPSRAAGAVFLWLEELIAANLAPLFPGLEVVSAHTFRIVRSHKSEIAPEFCLTGTAKGRMRTGRVALLQIDRQMPEALRQILLRNLEVHLSATHRGTSLLALSRVAHIMELAPLKTTILPSQAPRDWDDSLSA